MGSRFKQFRVAIFVSCSALLVPAAHSAPTGGQVSAGNGTIAQTGTVTTVNQSSQNMAINWQSFGIGANETVNFNQPSASSIALNRIIGQDPSQIFGSLNANGQVFVLNPNGVLFGKGTQVNVGGLVASTLSLSDSDFMNGNYQFKSNGTVGSVVNQGNLTAADGGYIALLAPEVRNEGVISATLGTALLAAGDNVTVKFDNGSLLSYSIDQGAIDALVDNKQLVKADGGRVIMSAKAANVLTTAVVNNTGIVEAHTIQNINGVITLMGDMQSGQVNVGGTLDASAPDGGNGGFIETSAAQVQIANDAKVSTLSNNGANGTWLIDPVDFTIAATGGNMTGATLSSNLGAGNVAILSSLGNTGTAGDVNVNDVVTWSANKLTLNAQNDININANLNASGTASLALEYGQVALVAGNLSDYYLNNGSQVNLSAGNNFSTKLGSNGVVKNYTVITSLGTEGSVTASDLQGINGNVAANYVLGADIDATSTTGWNAGAGFVPLGQSAHFSGTFDGLGHTISNLSINGGAAAYVGLIGYATLASVIRNVGLTNVSILAVGGYGGGLVGYSAGSISNSYATGTVAGDTTLSGGRHWGGYNLGGLVGWLNQGIVTNCYATVTITTVVDGYAAETGGLVGVNYQGSIINSYATGDVTGEKISGVIGSTFLGGLVGDNYGAIYNSYSTGSVTGLGGIGGLVGSSYGTVGNSYSSGNVVGVDAIGGLIGIVGSAGATVTGSYSTGNVVGTTNVGGLIGANAGTVTSSYWDTVTSGQATSAGGVGLTTAQMMQQANLTGFDFTNTWWMSDTDTRPFLRMEHSTNIINAHQLQLMATDLTASYTLGANIDLAELANANGMWDTSKGFVPVGEATAFSGSFDGMGYTINNISINRPATTKVGLFGFTSAASSIGNVGMVGGSLTGGTDVGGLAGYGQGSISDSFVTSSVTGGTSVGGLVGLNYGTINSSYAIGDVTGTVATAGGLVGTNNGGSISNSHFASGTVQGTNDVGGLIGSSLASGTVANSYSTGTVNASGYEVGGLVGSFGGGSISDSYAAGSVTTTGNATTGPKVGGLVGWNNGGLLSSSFASGNVTASSDSVGGLVGRNSNIVAGTAGRINNCYATGTISGSSTNVGGLVGNNAGGQLTNTYSSGSVSGTGGNLGGLVGSNSGGTVTRSYWDTTTSGQPTSAAGTGLTTAQMMQQNSYAGWDFSSTWILYDGYTDPLLRVFMTPLTVTAWSVSKTYDKIAYADSINVTYSSTPDGRLLGTPTNVGNAAGAIDAGTYSITPGGLYSTQFGYAMDFVSGSLVVNPAPLTVSRTLAGNKTYDGTTLAILTGGVLNGVISGDTVTLNETGTFASKNVGTAIVVTAADTLSGFSAPNYYLSAQPSGLTANIAKATLSVTANNATKTYGVSKTYSGTEFTSLGLVNSETIGSVTLSSTGDIGTANVSGSPYAITPISATGGTFSASNYAITYVNGALTVNTAPLTVTANAFTRTYNGLPYSGGNGAGYSGLVNGETSAVLGGTLAYSGTSQGALNAGGYVITPSGLTSGNYAISFANGALTVNKAPLTVTADNVIRDYDGQTYSGASLVQYSGLVNGESTAVLGGTLTFGGSSQGAVNAGNYVIAPSGLTSGNYAFTYVNGTLTVNKVALTVTADSASKTYGVSKTYSGTEFTSLGLVNNETIATVALSSLGDAGTANVSGSPYSIVPSAATGGSFSANNYNITYVNGALTVSKAPLTVTANNASKIYNGLAYSGGNGATYSGLVNGENSSVLGGTLAYSGTSQGAVNAASYVITPSGLTSGNYAITFQNGALTVNKAPLTVTAVNTSKVYDGLAYSGGNGATYSGLVNSETSAVLGGTLAYGGTSQGAVNAASYVITPSGLTSGNYSITYANGALTVSQAPLSITANAYTKTYDGLTYSGDNGVTYTGLVNSETSAVLGGTLTYGGSSQTARNAGNYVITPSGLTSGNYAITFVNGTLAVNRLAISVTGTVVGNKVYDGTTNAALSGGTLSGVLSGDTVTLTQSGTFSSKNVGTAITVTATDALGGASAANYQLTQPTGLSADITQATVSASIIGTPTKIYDATTTATLSSSNYSLTGFVTGEGATVGQTAGTYNSANVLTANTVTTTLASTDFTGNTGTSLSNYILPTSASGAGIITPAGYSTGASASTRLANRLEFRGTPFGNTTGSYLITPNGQYSTLYNISFGNDRLTVLSSPTQVDLDGGVFESWNGLWNAKKPRLQLGL